MYASKMIKFQKGCPHCEPDSFALKHPLLEAENFRIVCDVHPLSEGHILIIPREHISCVGAFSQELFKEFERLYKKVWSFLDKTYGNPAAFEHGVIGQTVFHSHVHILPFGGAIGEIIPESGVLKPLKSLSVLRNIFKKDGQYLFLALERKMWRVDPAIGTPRFFRERFAKTLGVSERSGWRRMRKNSRLLRESEREIRRVKEKWKTSF